MVRCADDTLYTGITTDLARRVAEHNGPKAAKYTRSRQPVTLIYQELAPSREVALQREYALKQLSRTQKIALART